VQGVGFRYAVRELAKGFMVVGWVKNLTDGRVEMLVQGEAEEVGEFLEEIEVESEVSHHISNSEKEDHELVDELRDFRILNQ